MMNKLKSSFSLALNTHFHSKIYQPTILINDEQITYMWRRWGHTSEFLFDIYWWTWKRSNCLKLLLKWVNKKQNNFNICNVTLKKRKKEKHLQISLSKSRWYDLQFLLQFLRYRTKHTKICNFRSFFCPFTRLKTPKIKI